MRCFCLQLMLAEINSEPFCDSYCYGTAYNIADTACIIILIYARGPHGTIRYTVCDLLSENPISLHIFDFKIFVIETWDKMRILQK